MMGPYKYKQNTSNPQLTFKLDILFDFKFSTFLMNVLTFALVFLLDLFNLKSKYPSRIQNMMSAVESLKIASWYFFTVLFSM